MTRRIERDPIYRSRRFSAETIELCVRWYVTYRLSYRDLAAMMAERGIIVSHTTIMRWVLRYVPEYDLRWARFAQPSGSSWRMDETAVNVRGSRHYLYRAVDKRGKSVASLLCNDRNMESAQAFFRSAIVHGRVPWPAKINIDGNKATLRGLRLLGEEDSRLFSVNAPDLTGEAGSNSSSKRTDIPAWGGPLSAEDFVWWQSVSPGHAEGRAVLAPARLVSDRQFQAVRSAHFCSHHNPRSSDGTVPQSYCMRRASSRLRVPSPSLAWPEPARRGIRHEAPPSGTRPTRVND